MSVKTHKARTLERNIIVLAVGQVVTSDSV